MGQGDQFLAKGIVGFGNKCFRKAFVELRFIVCLMKLKGGIVDIDNAMKLGCGYPMGPLTLGDFVGLDTTYYIAEIMFNEFREKRFAPPPLLKRMVLAGLYGRKSGRGFYDYTKDQKNPVPMNLV